VDEELEAEGAGAWVVVLATVELEVVLAGDAAAAGPEQDLGAPVQLPKAVE
jgi:hypothetical protein